MYLLLSDFLMGCEGQMVFWRVWMTVSEKVCCFKTKQELLHIFLTSWVKKTQSSNQGTLVKYLKKRKENNRCRKCCIWCFQSETSCGLIGTGWGGRDSLVPSVGRAYQQLWSSSLGLYKARLRYDLWWWQNSKHIWTWWNVLGHFFFLTAGDWRSLGINPKLHAYSPRSCWMEIWLKRRTKDTMLAFLLLMQHWSSYITTINQKDWWLVVSVLHQ